MVQHWEQANGDISFPQGGSEGVSNDALVLGAYSGQATFYGWRGLRYALGGNPDQFSYFDDFVTPGLSAAAAPWQADAGSTGAHTTDAAGLAGGVLVGTTAATDNDHLTLALSTTLSVANGWVFFDTRVQLPSIAGIEVEFGLNDALSEAAGVAFSDHTVAGATAVAEDAAVFAFSTEDSITTWHVNTVRDAATDVVQAVNTGTTVEAATWYQLGVAIDSSGNAFFYIDGARVATIENAVATDALLTPWLTVASDGGDAKAVNIDYVGVSAVRG